MSSLDHNLIKIANEVKSGLFLISLKCLFNEVVRAGEDLSTWMVAEVTGVNVRKVSIFEARLPLTLIL